METNTSFLIPTVPEQGLLGVVLELPTGVVYGHQCAGHLSAARLTGHGRAILVFENCD